MFELPEYIIIAKQMNETIAGKRIATGTLGNSPHKFVWYNRKPNEFAALIKGKTIGRAHVKGRWLFLPVEPGYVLVFGECGGRILFHASTEEIPKKNHLTILFDDQTALSAMTQMWGAMELYEKGQELKRKYICDMRPTPVDTEFTLPYFMDLVDECTKAERRSVKGILTQEQLIPGLGNSIAQDIMYVARLHPKHPLEALNKQQKQKLYKAITGTVEEAIGLGGREDEYDLLGDPGGYSRIMCRESVGTACPRCGAAIEKMHYLGGACYYCPGCQE